MPRLLYITPNMEDYASDGLLHGLRTLLGADVLDFPKAEHLYDTMTPAARARIRGGGFTLYGLLEDLPLERDHVLQRALAGEFDWVVFSDIWRTWGLFSEWGPPLHDRGVRIAVLDGSDRVEPYPFAGDWWRRRAWWFVPRAHTRAALHLKREVTPWTRWFASYLTLPPPLNRWRMPHIGPLAFSIPDEKIVAAPPSKDQDFPRHIVDAEVAARLGGQTGHAFAGEDEYVADLRRSRFGITTKREGWDALRHYEIAAAGTVPCFRGLRDKPAGCAPHGLQAGVNCLDYADAGDLLAQIGRLDDGRYAQLQAGALAWARANSTVARAREFLALCEKAAAR
jgi:hypothetical protein